MIQHSTCTFLRATRSSHNHQQNQDDVIHAGNNRQLDVNKNTIPVSDGWAAQFQNIDGNWDLKKMKSMIMVAQKEI